MRFLSTCYSVYKSLNLSKKMFDSVDLKDKLIQFRKTELKNRDVLDWVEDIFANLEKERDTIKDNLLDGKFSLSNNFKIEKLDPKKVFHISHIKGICCDYRLRFLSTSLFKGDYPEEAISKIRDLDNLHQTDLKGFKIIAPSKLFALKDPEDPCLFVPITKDYFYLIHKWGDDMSYFRKLKYWAVKNVENCIKAIVLLSVILTLVTFPIVIPDQADFVKVVLVFLFYFKSFIGFSILLYGISGKSFSEFCWKSEYNKIT